MTNPKLLVKQLRHEAEGVVSIELVDPTGADLPEWEPGAHIDTVLPNGVVRQYSLSGNPADRKKYRIGVLDEPASRGGSRWIHEELRVGSLIEVSLPRNHFAFTVAKKVRFIGGGIGVTPILPMIRMAEQHGVDWRMTYGGRTRTSMAFLDELHDSRVTVCPQDETGLIDFVEAVGTPDSETMIYACGPGPMLAALEEYCRDWPDGALHVERFAAPDGPAPVVGGEYTGDIEVVAERSGIEVVVPAGEPIMDCLEKAGVNTPFSCREGICGSCETRVIEGVPSHHDYVLTDDEKAAGETMMICVSRTRTPRLVLDI